MNRPSVRQLEYFVAVSRFGSFRRAAEALDVSQPTITAQVAQIEKTLGVSLFERGRSGAKLTPAGRQLMPIARRALEELDNLVSAAGSAATGTATYRLGVKSTLGPYILPPILAAIHSKHRKLKLYVREEPPTLLETNLESGDLDLIMTALPTNAGEFQTEALFRENIMLVMSAEHPLAKTETVRGKDLEGVQLLTTEAGHKLSRMVEQLASRYGAEVLRDYEGTSLDALRLMVVMGVGVALLPSLYIRHEIEDDPTLVVRKIEGESLARTVGLAWRPGSPGRGFYRLLARDMRDVLREELGQQVKVLEA